ncbi:MAG TPA: hypothetical protein VKP10_09860 [Gemmatimonadales bacterium]|nr:hypothetical protein [Gemmatimonadales bacterium]
MRCVAAERRGIALPLVLWALVIGSALLTVAVFLILQEQRAGQAGRRLVHTFTRAEADLAEALQGWTPGSLNRALPGVRDSLGTVGSDLTIRRLNQGLFLLAVSVRDGATEARLGRLVRVRPVHLAATAALTSGGQVRLDDAATISGEDLPPAGSEDCPPADSAVAGVAAPSVLATASSVIKGSPPSIERPWADSGLAFEDLLVFHDLMSQATLTLASGTWQTRPATVGTVCNPLVPENWGDPNAPGGPCGAYRPIVYVAGDLELLSGRGQGILLVEGHLTVHGPYDFAGLLMVRGGLDVASGDSAVRLNGAVFAGSLGSQTTPPAVLSITYSKCLLSKALLSSGQLVPLRTRSWKALF